MKPCQPWWKPVKTAIPANNVKVIQACVGEFYGHTKLYLGLGATTSEKVAQENTFFYGNSPENYIFLL